jgi:multiple sugar transport system substrate-binding protein
MDMAGFQRIFEKREVEYCSIPSWEKGTGPWCTVNMALGVNKQCSYKKESMDFVKFLLRSDIQSIFCSTTDSMPVNKKAREILRDIWIGNAKFFDYRYPITRQDTEVVDSFIKECKEIVFTDPVIRNIMKDEVTSLISGNKTAEQTAKSIQDKVNTYLKQ